MRALRCRLTSDEPATPYERPPGRLVGVDTAAGAPALPAAEEDGAGGGALRLEVVVGVVFTGGGTGVPGVETVGAGTVVGTGAGGGFGVGTGTVGAGTVGLGNDGTVTAGTETDGTVTVGVETVGIPTPYAEAARKPAAARPARPQMVRTEIQRGTAAPVPGRRAFLRRHMGLGQDHYEVLGVRRDASGDEIKRAFRSLARRLHPDVAESDDGAFHDVVSAYEVLSHPGRRRLYDRLGIGGRRPAAAPGVPPLDASLEWYEAERGAAKALEIEESLVCPGCEGAGVARGVVAGVCVTCRGAGHVSSVRESPTARLVDVRTCPACGGRGHTPAPACPTCAGSGRTIALQTLRVRFPAGVRDGDLVQFDGIDRRVRVAVTPRPRDSRVLLTVAAFALVCALGLLAFLLSR